MEDAFPVDAPVGMCAKVITLRLGQIGRQALAAIGIEIGQGSRVASTGMPSPIAACTTSRQAAWRLQDYVPEGIIEQQVGQLRIALEVHRRYRPASRRG